MIYDPSWRAAFVYPNKRDDFCVFSMLISIGEEALGNDSTNKR